MARLGLCRLAVAIVAGVALAGCGVDSDVVVIEAEQSSDAFGDVADDAAGDPGDEQSDSGDGSSSGAGDSGDGDDQSDDGGASGTDGSGDSSTDATDDDPGTTANEPNDTTEPKDTTEPAAPAGDADAPVPTPETDLEFRPCPGGECATVAAPIDPDQPELGTIDIAVNVIRSADPDQRRGYLLVNPGGPGGSGREFAQAFPFIAPAELLDAFDIVGFDPRGVAGSEPTLGCGGRDVVRTQTAQVDGAVDTDAEVEALEELVAACAEVTGPAAPYLGTEFVAHDMEAVRLALGAEQISFYGASYGTSIGVFYASLYPDSVRAMVVDGSDNPLDDVSTQELRIDAGLEQVRGFEELLGRALESCDDASCPIFNDGDPVGYYLDAVEKIDLV
ncbi:MAG: alpha/beta fold hydrolase, partial [Actinomycetota bacterium]